MLKFDRHKKKNNKKFNISFTCSLTIKSQLNLYILLSDRFERVYRRKRREKGGEKEDESILYLTWLAFSNQMK